MCNARFFWDSSFSLSVIPHRQTEWCERKTRPKWFTRGQIPEKSGRVPDKSRIGKASGLQDSPEDLLSRCLPSLLLSSGVDPTARVQKNTPILLTGSQNWPFWFGVPGQALISGATFREATAIHSWTLSLPSCFAPLESSDVA